MSLLKPKPKRNTWAQVRRARYYLRYDLGERNTGTKSPLHVARILRRNLVRKQNKLQIELQRAASGNPLAVLA